MPGPRRSLASPVVSGVLCQCSPPRAAADGGVPGPRGRALCGAPEQERRLHALFQKLDVNRDGALCVHDLAVGLGRLGLYRTERDLWVSAGSRETPAPPRPLGGAGSF